jgi:DNA-binding response OmpR family regulator
MMSMKHTILVIDDQCELLDIVKTILEDAGFSVITSKDSSIVPHIKLIKPDLILLDYWLADGRGDEICLKLKEDKCCSDIPVILFSAANNLEQKAAKAKADGIIQKPFSIEYLISQVRSYLVKA